MENTSALKMVHEHGWLNGFANLFHAANSSFWGTRKWMIQAGLWLVLLNGPALFLWKIPADKISELYAALDSIKTMQAVQQNMLSVALILYVIFVAIGFPIAAIIAGQDAIIGERQSGTAAWVLSKPVSRPAFILSRLASRALGILIAGLVIHGVAVYAQLSLRIGSWWPAAEFAGAMGLAFLNTLFYLTLTYMLGALFSNRGAVLGISLSVALIGPVLLRSMPVLKDITPWTFFLDQSGNLPDGYALLLGQPAQSPIPIICTAVMCVLFTIVTILRFQREEF